MNPFNEIIELGSAEQETKGAHGGLLSDFAASCSHTQSFDNC